MKRFRLLASLLLVVALGVGLSRCGSSGTTVVNTYITSSNKGDLATFNFNGDTLTVEWKITNTTVGTVKKTLNITASCAAADSTYGSRSCTVTTSSCTDGTAACVSGDAPSSGSIFKATEAPGIGLMVLTPDSSQLFVGITAGSCDASVTGKYIGMNMGVGQYNIFTLFQPNSAFTSLQKANFRVTGGANVSSPTFRYDGTDTPHDTITLTGATCSSGVRTFTIGGNTYSATLTQNGMFVIDAPAGQGGIVAFDLANAATLSDIAGKSFKGFTFPDNSTPRRLSVTTGTAGSSSVSISALSLDDGSTMTPLPSIKKIDADATFTNPSSTPTTYSTGAAYSSNSFSSTYANIAAIPGMYFIPPQTGDHGHVLVGAMKQGGKVLLFGVVFNDRSGGSPAVPTTTAYPNTGAFIAFEQ
jgi:hypothetical protein